ncbi:BTB domain-containing protein [Favolaschia claudopus]|uniref:BTB domain-containing protein n=1 Tax=Favolaschia claudopus TaxID=2862362 RepID=A0AAW0BHP6_9AGAR
MSESESPPAKRQRTDDTEVMRSDIWKADGSVVLQAGNTQFRVHWSVLAENSSVFSDMQGLPQPSDQPTVEGCSIVELSDDPDDIKFLLKALYIPSFHCQDKLPFPVVRAFVKIGRKYEFKYLYDSAVKRLMTEFPTTLKEYDAFRAAWQTMEGYPGLTRDIASLANENKLLTVLPAAYYSLSMHTASKLLTQIQRRDSTMVASLPTIDLCRCAVGREEAFKTQFQPGFTLGWIRKWDFADLCLDSMQCQASRQALLVYCMDNYLRANLITPQWPVLKRFQFCQNCLKMIHDSIVAGRKKGWEQLPLLFDLPPWNELKNGD